MDDSLYDEFGNYIGPEIESDQESDRDEEDENLPDRPGDEAVASDGDRRERRRLPLPTGG
ncbi:hypothetical protein L484_009953 [Morus notabilis]|uniref:116kDa U5 small nuclear ribonucleoprotein component N-terminal domain-containing protein n=1 Tax=Morus notabilis TaxID=981085 RepID=W9RIF7_9ROSA|nr:hypothetical protein L484_009953 [Morus notabilis]